MKLPGWADRRLALKLAGLILVMVSLVIAGVAAFLILHERREHEEDLQQRGLLVTTQLARESVNPILREDDYALFKLVQAVGRNRGRDLMGEEIVVYAMVMDGEGKVLARTSAVPPDGPAGPRPAGEAPPPVPRVRPARMADGERLYDVTVPVLMRGVPIGAARLGLSRHALDRLLMGTALRVLGILFAAMLVGVAIIWRFSRGLAGPIARLSEAARRVRAGDLSARVDARRRDEIGELGAAFNSMTEALERSQEELSRKETVRTQLLQRVITAQEEERRRIARELHDETGQALTSVMVGLRLLERTATDGTREAIGEMRRTVSQTLEAVHDLSLQLRPSALDDLGLVPALERCLADFERKYGIGAAFQANRPAHLRLVPAVETTLYRIAQEALTNIARYAAASRVSLVLETRRGLVTLIVEDNGRGFDVAGRMSEEQESRCLGILGMRERAALLGGTLTIESTPGSGTTIFVEVPLPEEAGDERRQAEPDPAGR